MSPGLDWVAAGTVAFVVGMVVWRLPVPGVVMGFVGSLAASGAVVCLVEAVDRGVPVATAYGLVVWVGSALSAAALLVHRGVQGDRRVVVGLVLVGLGVAGLLV